MAEHALPPPDGSHLNGYRASLIRQARRTMGQADAEDIASEALLVGFRDRDRYDPSIASESTWIKGIAAKLIARHHRRVALQQRVLPRLAVEPPVPSTEDGALARLEAVALLAASAAVLQHLPAVDHELVVKSASALIGGYHAGLATNERVRLHRIRQKLLAPGPAAEQGSGGSGVLGQ